MRRFSVELALPVVLALATLWPCTVRATVSYDEDELVSKWKDMESSMRQVVQEALKKALPEVLRMGQEDGGLSAPCTSAFIGVLRRLGNLDKEVMKMIDASGKLAPGLLDGSLTDFGDFEECLSVAVPDTSSEDGALLFRGQYCMVKSRPPLPPKPRFVNKHFAAVNLTLFPENSVMRQFAKDAGTFFTTTARTGLCMPSVCSKEDVEAIAKNVFRGMHWDATVSGLLSRLGGRAHSERQDFHVPYSEDSPGLSAYETARKILVVVEPAEEETRRLQVFHGLRALSIVWIVWVHHYAYNDTSVYSGAKIAKKLVVQYNTQPFNNAWLAVDTFFFISGFFLLFAINKQMKSAGLGQVLLYIVVRWWRLIPMACVGMFALTLIRHFGEGPLWNEYINAEIEKCDKNWWLLLLNVQNFLKHDELCLVPYWYLSVDTQLHVFFIGFAILLYRNFYFSATAMLFLVITSTIVVACQTFVHNYTPTALFVAGDSMFAKEVLEQIYFRPYTHFGPFCLGIITAYAFLAKKPRFELGWACQGAAWMAAFVGGATVLFCTKQWGDGNDLPVPWISAAYASCHRLVWALCIGWLVFACISDRGGLINSVLSSPLLVPLSRLSYAVYVLHVPIVWFRLWTIRERILIWFLPMFYNAMGSLVLSFFVALGASIFIERPLMAAKDEIVSRITRPRNHKPSPHPDGPSNKRGGRSDVLSERRLRSLSLSSIASKLSYARIFARQTSNTATTPGFQSELCTVHL
ncbi:hypothetical protein MRX96_003607 [Rhipicephalus microplus]